MNKKLNILHWPTSYPDPNRNQPYHSIFIQEHIQSTKNLVNNKVLFISAEKTINKFKWHEEISTLENGVHVTRFYFNQNLKGFFLNIYVRIIIICYFIKQILVKGFYPNLIHIHFFPAGEWVPFFSKIFKIRTVVTEHWTALIGYPVISAKRFEKAKRVYENASYVLPVSSHLGIGILQNTRANITHKMQVIHNSVDTRIFKTHSQVDASFYNIISVVRLAEQKDIPNMLKAFQLVIEKLSIAKLTVIGGGDSKPFIEIAESLQIKHAVEFLGPLPKTKIAELMNQSNLFILSSISENSPCVIGEAHCCGLPVVATDVGGVKELIMEGAVVPPKSPESLAAKILEQLDKKVDRVALAQKAQAHFSYDAIGQQIFEVYQKVCAE